MGRPDGCVCTCRVTARRGVGLTDRLAGDVGSVHEKSERLHVWNVGRLPALSAGGARLVCTELGELGVE